MDREIYSLKVYSTRMEYDSFQLELTPKENEEANDYYGMNYNVTVWCRGQMCAKLWGKLYDENLVYSCGMDILNAADPFGREEVALAEAFNKSQELCVREEKWQNIQGFSGYIQGVFVVPQYRRRGIASYLLTPCDEYPDPGGGNLADAGGGIGWRRGGRHGSSCCQQGASGEVRLSRDHGSVPEWDDVRGLRRGGSSGNRVFCKSVPCVRSGCGR